MANSISFIPSTASFATNALTASALNFVPVSASYATTASYSLNGGGGSGGTTLTTGSTYPITASWSNHSSTASLATYLTGSQAIINSDGGSIFSDGNGGFSNGSSNTIAFNVAAHSEGLETTATGTGSHSEGFGGLAAANYSHTEGAGNTAYPTAFAAHVEGSGNSAYGPYSHASGGQTTTLGTASFTTGFGVVSSGSFQTVMGTFNKPHNTSSLLIVGNGSSTLPSDILLVNSQSVIISGSLNVTNGITSSLNGTATSASFLNGHQALINSDGGKIVSNGTGLITTYNAIPTAGLGIPVIVGSVNILNANNENSVGPVTLYTPPTNGLFRISTYCSVLGDSPDEGSIDVTLSYTDDNGTQGPTDLSTTLSFGAPNTGQSVIMLYNTAGNPITYTITVSGTSGDGAYNLNMVLEQLQ